MPVAPDHLMAHVIQIKWLTVAIMVIFIIGLAAVLYIILSFKKLLRGDPASSNFRANAKLLLNMNDLDGLIAIAQERISRFPGELFAHWYLGLAYYRKKEWHKALSEFNYIYEIEPSWRFKHLNPYIFDIKEQLKNSRLEVIKK